MRLVGHSHAHSYSAVKLVRVLPNQVGRTVEHLQLPVSSCVTQVYVSVPWFFSKHLCKSLHMNLTSCISLYWGPLVTNLHCQRLSAVHGRPRPNEWQRSFSPAVVEWETEISVRTMIPASACRTQQSIYNTRWGGKEILILICLKNPMPGLCETLNNWSSSQL